MSATRSGVGVSRRSETNFDPALSTHELYGAAHDLLATLSRDHESCCAREAYAFELAADDLYAASPQATRTTLPPSLARAGLDKRRLALGLLEHLILLADTRDEEDAVISAHHWTSLAHLNH